MAVSIEALEKKLLSSATRKESLPEFLDWLDVRAETIITRAELASRLKESARTKKPLRIKYGIDPTRPDIHMGHAVPLLLLRRFQRLGHKVVLIFGDFTATIGDPSGRVAERPQLTRVQVRANVKQYEKYAGKFLDIRRAEVHYNSEWFDKIKLAEFFEYLRLQTVSAAVQREDFRTRESVTRAELLYASLQAIDSVQINADVEVGGRDQLLNLIEGRELMGKLARGAGVRKMRPQIVLTTRLLPGLEGGSTKMSKTADNYIGVSDTPENVYGKVMSIPDESMWIFYRLLTDISRDEFVALERAVKSGSIHPKAAKQLLARAIVYLLHPDLQKVRTAEASFERVFAKKLLPEKIQAVRVEKTIADLPGLLLAAKVAPSRSEAKRLVAGGAVHLVSITGTARADAGVGVVHDLALLKKSRDFVLQVGKRRFVKIFWK